MEPACSQACPTDSIRFGPIRELKPQAEARVPVLAHLDGINHTFVHAAAEH